MTGRSCRFRLMMMVSALGLFAGAGGCKKPIDEALVVFPVQVDASVPAFASLIFAVTDRAGVPVRSVPGDTPAHRGFRFGYYMPGISGTVTIRGRAEDAAGCTVGEGTLSVAGVVAGQTTEGGTMTIAGVAAVCTDNGDASTNDTAATDASTSDTAATDASPADAGADAVSDTARDATLDATDATSEATSDVGSDTRFDAAPDTASAGPDTGAPDLPGDRPDPSTLAPPRLVAPLSTATVTSRRPLLHWMLPAGVDGAHVQICRDRACANPVVAFDATGTSGAPPSDLPVGVVFWHAFARSAGVTGTTSSPTWEFFVGALTAPINTSWGSTLDVNGDGYADVIVGAAGFGTGRAYLYLGTPSGLSSTQPPIALVGPAGTTNFGSPVANAGDINGDGFSDLLISGSLQYVYLGSLSGLSAGQPLPLAAGSAAVPVDDVNGDGYADVMTLSPQGMALLYFGGPSGLSSSQQLASLPAGGIFGVGDVNGDDHADVIFGTTLYLGGPSGLLTQQPIALINPDGVGTGFGSAVAGAGDVNGDGYADVVVGAQLALNETGKAYVYLGGTPSFLSSEQPIAFTGPDGANTDFGRAAASAGDVNRDGYSDLVIGAPFAAGGSGRAYIYLGGPSGPLPTQQPAVLTGPDGTQGRFGSALARTGDLNNDGYGDVIVGALGALADLGRAYIYSGSALGVSPTQQPIVFTGTDVDGDFGASVGR